MAKKNMLSFIRYNIQDLNFFTDNMMNEDAMLAWIEENLKANLDVIEDLSFAQIKQMVKDREYVLIYACKFT